MIGDVMLGLLFLQVKPQTAPPPMNANAILKQMYHRYDTAASYDGMLTTTIKSPNGQSTTVVHAQCEGDRRGSIGKSRIEILTAAGKGVSQLVRIDDGKDLWLVQPGANSFTRDVRKPDKLSNLFRPFFSAVEAFAPTLKVRRSKLKGLSLIIISGSGRKGGFVQITLDGPTQTLREASAVLAAGETMKLSISEQTWDKPLRKSLFEFHAPPGARQLPAPRPGGVFGIPNTGKKAM